MTGDGAVKWDVETCNAENASYYMSGNGLTGQYGKVYMEYYAKYTEFSAYCTSTDRLTEKDFGMTFYKLTREKNFIGGLVPPPTPTQKGRDPDGFSGCGRGSQGHGGHLLLRDRGRDDPLCDGRHDLHRGHNGDRE